MSLNLCLFIYELSYKFCYVDIHMCMVGNSLALWKIIAYLRLQNTSSELINLCDISLKRFMYNFSPTYTIESYLLCHQDKPMILIDPSGKCHIMQRAYMSQNNKLSKITFKKLKQWYLDYISIGNILKNTLKKLFFFWLIKTIHAFLWVSLMVNINMMKNGGKVKINR